MSERLTQNPKSEPWISCWKQRGPLDEIEEDTKVAKKGRSEEQILRALRQAEGGTRVADICREHGIS